MKGARSATVDFNGCRLILELLTDCNARELLEEVRSGKANYYAISDGMPGRSIGGGGQPLHHGDSSITASFEAIYREDAGKPIRKSHENPYITKLYNEFLGKPMSEKSHQLLHTHYFAKGPKDIYI